MDAQYSEQLPSTLRALARAEVQQKVKAGMPVADAINTVMEKMSADWQQAEYETYLADRD